MIFFRQKLHEVITLPPPPVDDLTEAYEVEEITLFSKNNKAIKRDR